MTHHILILGDNLTGLVTAYRLLHYGFHISIVDTRASTQPKDPSSLSSESIPSICHQPLSAHEEIPLILHGFYHATWAFLQEISFTWPPHITHSVNLEFGTEGKTPIALPKPSRLKWLHPLIQFTLFKGLPWSDRWHMINFLEKQWEDNLLSQPHPDTENVESWLISAKQSAHSHSHFWNPLCRFFLNCELSQASLGSFMEILSQYWFGQPTDAATFLAPPNMLGNLDSHLRQLLTNRGVQFYISEETLTIQTSTDGIQAVEIDHTPVHAHAYVSTLNPHHLSALLPERVLTRYTHFASLAQIPKSYGLAVQLTLPDILLQPRIILNVHPFDCITSQPHANADSPKTMITCITVPDARAQELPNEWFIHTAQAFIHNLFNLSAAQTSESNEVKIFRQAGLFYPCHSGSRTHRPLAQTPIPNFFLAGPWTAPNLPTSLETSINSANACAEAVATAFYQTAH